MYKYRSNRKEVRFVFPDGDQINLMRAAYTLKLPATKNRPEKRVKVRAATDKDFKRILEDDRYKSIHNKIYEVKDAAAKTNKEKKSDSSDPIPGV
ncbi:MAG TPA: hypothetical protein VK031_04755 [Tissierellaceae bacterium]|nr:hypothetical protein [Tissierellaceae bacterium]